MEFGRAGWESMDVWIQMDGWVAFCLFGFRFVDIGMGVVDMMNDFSSCTRYYSMREFGRGCV